MTSKIEELEHLYLVEVRRAALWKAEVSLLVAWEHTVRWDESNNDPGKAEDQETYRLAEIDRDAAEKASYAIAGKDAKP